MHAHAIEGNRFVLEGAYFNLERISSILKLYGMNEMKDKFILIGLVQNQKTAEEYIQDFRKYDTEDDWTYRFTEKELRDYVINDAIPSNRSMQAYLTNYGFTIYDTSHKREQVFQQIIEDIKLAM